MKKATLFSIIMLLLMCSCNDKKVKYDPYGHDKKSKKPRTEVSEIKKGFDVPFTYENGVRYVMITMNGKVGIKAIFDTGCSSMSISTMEFAQLLKTETILNSDIGEASYTLADETSKTTSSVKMNVSVTDTDNKTHETTAEAIVMENMFANALIGNTILSQLGSKITIDDDKQIIHFE